MFHPRVGRPENTYPAGGACGEEFGRRKKGVGGGENGERNEGFWGGGAGKSGEKGQGGSAERMGGAEHIQAPRVYSGRPWIYSGTYSGRS